MTTKKARGRRYPDSVKVQAVKEYIRSRDSAHAAQKVGVSRSSVCHWFNDERIRELARSGVVQVTVQRKEAPAAPGGRGGLFRQYLDAHPEVKDAFLTWVLER